MGQHVEEHGGAEEEGDVLEPLPVEGVEVGGVAHIALHQQKDQLHRQVPPPGGQAEPGEEKAQGGGVQGRIEKAQDFQM